MLKEFKNFMLRGNILVIAIGLAMAAAFTKVVDAFTSSVISPIVGMIGGRDFRDIGFTINKSRFPIGILIDAAIAFVITAFAIFVLIVRPAMKMGVKFEDGK